MRPMLLCLLYQQVVTELTSPLYQQVVTELDSRLMVMPVLHL